MSKNPTNKKLKKKEARQRVYDKLVVALSDFKTGVKDKKFEKKLRRTSRLFAVDLVKSDKKEKAAMVKLLKKNGRVKTEEAAQKTV